MTDTVEVVAQDSRCVVVEQLAEQCRIASEQLRNHYPDGVITPSWQKPAPHDADERAALTQAAMAAANALLSYMMDNFQAPPKYGTAEYKTCVAKVKHMLSVMKNTEKITIPHMVDDDVLYVLAVSRYLVHDRGMRFSMDLTRADSFDRFHKTYGSVILDSTG